MRVNRHGLDDLETLRYQMAPEFRWVLGPFRTRWRDLRGNEFVQLADGTVKKIQI